MTVEEAFKKFDEEFTKEILSNPDFIAQIASGATASFLESSESSSISKSQYIKVGLRPFEKDKGRGENKSNTGGLVDAIYEWLKYKKYGISYKDDKERLSIAIAIARKIAKEGSYKFRNIAKRTSVYEDAFSKTFGNLEADLADIEVSRTLSIFDALNLND